MKRFFLVTIDNDENVLRNVLEEISFFNKMSFFDSFVATHTEVNEETANNIDLSQYVIAEYSMPPQKDKEPLIIDFFGSLSKIRNP